ncbi:MAG TPA: SNF2-related protein [Isosphaeraceae bacterium]|jgi:superfamily II DNA or RNA helicase|nr:SNF2-related protein [Isosphaeraceae bacterium]
MMGIAQKVARDFADGVRSRGQSYFAKGRVSLLRALPGEVVAKVRGTAAYKVRLRLRGTRLLASCTCPYFAPLGSPCKHLWATVLAADARGLLASPPVRPLDLVPIVPHKAAPGADPQGQPPYQGQGQGQGQGPGPLPYPLDLPPNPPRPSYPYPSAGQHPHPQGQPYPYAHPNSNSQAPQRPRGYPPKKGGRNDRPMSGPRHRPGFVEPAIPGLPPKRNRRAVAGQVPGVGPTAKPPKPAKRALYFVLDVPATLAQNQVVIELARRERKPNGERGPLRPWWHTPTAAAAHRPAPEDRELLAVLDQAQVVPSSSSSAPTANGAANGPSPTPTRRYVLAPERQAAVVERLAKSGRLRLRRAEGETDPPTLRWDDGPPWRFGLDARADAAGKRWSWRGVLRRPRDQRMDLVEPLVLVPGLLILGAGRAARFDDAGVFLWVARLRHEKELVFDAAQHDVMLGKIVVEARVPPSDLLENLRLVEVVIRPQPCLTLRTPRQNWGTSADRLLGEVAFDYDGCRVPALPIGPVAVQLDRRRIIRRDESSEQASLIKLIELGFRETKDFRVEPGTLELPPKRLAQATRELVLAGWLVEAEGKLIRPPGEFRLAVTTGIDWFELDGQVNFGGGQEIPLPELLAAARRGDEMVTLGDGSMGMLPDDWLKRYGLLAGLGTSDEGHIRFGRAQAGLLDALLAAQPEVRVDAGFSRVRQQLHDFDEVRALEAPEGFHGELRPYQREGLGWLDYLRRFGFGGILADDMGLGKTVQVLALLQRRKVLGLSEGPTLIVMPRSLVFNWMQEAERFTPGLKLLDYTGPGRPALRQKFDEHDLILTTYGTLRTDVVELSKVEFDYLILDEAQAIKTATSQAAKAARLLKGRHRLALSGTPIENHLGELWSIMEFLNPGMLGGSTVFKKLAGAGTANDAEGRALLAKALKPFILRRTKGQVLDDLPEKTEQTLYCEMEPSQRKLYEELRAHYRQALLRKGDGDLKKSKIEVLEALLRLRQAACHPALIDPERADDPAAKLDMLLPQLAEVVEEGHKVLVFSQFTSLLALVRKRLDEEGLRYEYLDGRTRNRAERVESFQNDPEIPLFLISLKAGGLGLNLTAAGYVYLLDPWWNPAVEAQAIDRSHRIGQSQHVFAYRLICRETVEQKILELQQRKRELADAILNADNRLIKNITRDDLEFLLS